jgi:hypothetical protein
VLERARGVSQKAIGGANPKGATSIFREATCIVAGDRRVGVPVEDGELEAIEAGDTSFSRDPEVSVAGLEDLVNTILRKAVLTRPGLMTKGAGNRWFVIFAAIPGLNRGVCACIAGQEKHGKEGVAARRIHASVLLHAKTFSGTLELRK